jgi:hypothetical protein
MAAEAGTTRWALKGTVMIACNCDFGCPCNFNALPSRGYCEGGWTWHVDEGRLGDAVLDGLNFTVMVKWPGAIHEGNGEALVLVDERADEAQSEAIATLVKGDIGGPWGILAWTWPTVHGPKPVAYEVEFDGIHSRVKAGGALEVESTTITNPVSGAQVHPGIVLPEGIIVKQAELGASQVFRVNEGISFDHSGQYTAVGPFDYSGP